MTKYEVWDKLAVISRLVEKFQFGVDGFHQGLA
jgi:hypothetical protein